MKRLAQIPNEKSINRCATTLFWYCFLSYAVSYLGRQNFSACLPAMITDGIMDKTWGGYISTAYMFIYGAGQFINGMGGTRIKPQYMIGTGLMGASVMNLLMSMTSSSWTMLVIWGINGLFQSMLWAPIIRVFTDRLPEHKKYTAGVNIALTIPIGTVFAYLIPGILLNFTSWRVVFFVAGVFLFVAFSVWVVGHMFLKNYIVYMDEKCVQEREMCHPQNSAEEQKKHSFFGVVLSMGLLWVLPCLFCNGALKDAVTAWIPTFFSERFGMSESNASLITIIVPVVSVSGAYISTWLNKRFVKNELLTGSVMFLITTLCMVGVFLCHKVSPILCAVFLAMGISSMWGASTMFLTMLPYHFAKLNLSSAVTGLLNCFAYFSSAACTSIYGILVDLVGWHMLTVAWIGVGVFGVAWCFLSGKVWAKKATILDEVNQTE